MNQILSIENQKNKTSKPIEIKGIIKFFAFTIMIFGIILCSQGIYNIYKNVDAKKPENIPNVKIGRNNDKAILNIEHNTQIAKITYYWDNGAKTVLPVGALSTNQEITLLGYDSTLYLIVEDINGKQVSYQKQYLLTGQDITKPSIEIKTENGSNTMTITAKDETAIAYLSYQWEGEEPVIVDYEQEGQKEIIKSITLTPGTKKITIMAEDMNGNTEQIEKEIVATTSEPEINITQKADKIIIEANDKDGIKDVIVNLNGAVYALRDINLKELKAGPLPLQEGNNTISVEVINVSGYKKTQTKELQYTP